MKADFIPSETQSRTLVMKFGGTSVGSADAIASVVNIVQTSRGEWPRLVVVVSALSGVTNLLLETANRAAGGDTDVIQQSADKMMTQLEEITFRLVPDAGARSALLDEESRLISEGTHLCQAISVLGEASPRALDAVASLGERMSVRLVADALLSAGVPSRWVEATRLILTDDHFLAAHPDMLETTHRTRQVLNPILDGGQVAVVTGFIAANARGATTTLGRGGSDYSAALLAAALPAQDVWIWTDVDGVMTTDPRLVKEAVTIPELSYREVSELAYFGAKVLHPKTIRPVIDAGIGLRVCNTFNPSHPGTRLVTDMVPLKGRIIKAITAIRGLQLITVEGRGMLGVPGVAARTFGAVAETGTSVPLISQASSEQSICFAVPSEAADRVLSALNKEFLIELNNQDIDRVWATEEVVIITVVGAGMRNTPGISGRVFSALGAVGVNVIAIAQGSSEVSISLIINDRETQPAVAALHKLINH